MDRTVRRTVFYRYRSKTRINTAVRRISVPYRITVHRSGPALVLLLHDAHNLGKAQRLCAWPERGLIESPPHSGPWKMKHMNVHLCVHPYQLAKSSRSCDSNMQSRQQGGVGWVDRPGSRPCSSRLQQRAEMDL